MLDQLKEWLESQLETSTVDGGNEILPGVYVEEIDPAWDMGSIRAILSDNTYVIFTITPGRF